jgi:hypothetical protein
MLRSATLLATVTLFSLLAPVVSHADQGPGTAAAPAAATVQAAAFSVGPRASEPIFCHQESAKVAGLLPMPHPLTCGQTCNSSTNCRLLCGDFAFCNIMPHQTIGHCTEQ